MPYIIIAIIAIAIITFAVFFIRDERESKRRTREALDRIASLPESERLNELYTARRECVRARRHLGEVRRAFNKHWGYRSNPFFYRLLIAQASYNAAREWVTMVENLCDRSVGSEV